MKKLKNWQPITDRIIKKDLVYTTKDFKPTHKDIADILDIDENANIAHLDNEMLIFKCGELESCGEVFIGSGKIEKAPKTGAETFPERGRLGVHAITTSR